jgi:excisionase family DNA binding protein
VKVTDIELTTEQAAQLLNRSVRTVTLYADQGRLRGRKVGRSWRFTMSEVERFKQQMLDESAQEGA